MRSKSSRSSSSTSSTRLKYVEEAAKQKDLEAKFKVFEEQQALAEKKFQLQQQEELLSIKSVYPKISRIGRQKRNNEFFLI